MTTSRSAQVSIGGIGVALECADPGMTIGVPAETERLAFSAKLLTLECGIRFLTDHLKGDVYFKIHRAGHNLDRARTQFKMVAEMERRMDEMDAVVRKYL